MIWLARPEHGREPPTGGVVENRAQVFRGIDVGERERVFVRQHKSAQVDGFAVRMLADLAMPRAVALAAPRQASTLDGFLSLG